MYNVKCIPWCFNKWTWTWTWTKQATKGNSVHVLVLTDTLKMLTGPTGRAICEVAGSFNDQPIGRECKPASFEDDGCCDCRATIAKLTTHKTHL